MTESEMHKRACLDLATAFESIVHHILLHGNPNTMTGDDWLNVFIEAARQWKETAEAIDD